MLGVLFAIALIRLKMPVMSVAIGLYLPLKLSVPIMLGGIIAATMGAVIVKRIDGDITDIPSEEATKTVDAMQARGVLIGAGYIAGESLLGVLLAVLIVLDVDLSAMSASRPRRPPSLLFFFWFVAVFVALVAQTMPKGITPGMVIGVMTNAVRRVVGRLIPKDCRQQSPDVECERMKGPLQSIQHHGRGH